MLEKPEIGEEKIKDCLRREYQLHAPQVTFLPLGADVNTAVYRITAAESTYFLKMRRAPFIPAAVTVPQFLYDRGCQEIIPPLPTRSGTPWTTLDLYALILYPFIIGKNGFEKPLTDQQRVALGAFLNRLHSTLIPKTLTARVRPETFSPKWRNIVRRSLAQITTETFSDPLARECARFLSENRAKTLDLVRRAEQLARLLIVDPPPFTLCHGDIHAWNMLIDGEGALFIVDWDTLIFAPKERDLMFVGSGLGGNGHLPSAHSLEEEKELFYTGYGNVAVNHSALAYYRFERIIADIAVFCVQILKSDTAVADRRQAIEFLKSNFLPGNTIEIAFQADQTRE